MIMTTENYSVSRRFSVPQVQGLHDTYPAESGLVTYIERAKELLAASQVPYCVISTGPHMFLKNVIVRAGCGASRTQPNLRQYRLSTQRTTHFISGTKYVFTLASSERFSLGACQRPRPPSAASDSLLEVDIVQKYSAPVQSLSTRA